MSPIIIKVNELGFYIILSGVIKIKCYLIKLKL